MPQTTLDGLIPEEIEARTIAKIKIVRERVQYILEHYPSSRGNDRELIFRYYKVFEPWVGLKIRDFSVLLNMTSMETVRRRAQEFRARGEYLPTDRTTHKRRIISEIPQGMI